MDAQKKIRNYICPNPWLRRGAIALLIAALTLITIGFGAFTKADLSVYPFSPQDSAAGTMAKVEITGVSHWLYRTARDTYYVATDAEGRSITLCLTETQFSRMGEQAAYFLFQAGDIPEGYPLRGCVQPLPEEVLAGLAEIWGITQAQYQAEYGNLVLNCTTTSRRQAASPWVSPAIVCALAGLALLLYWRRREQNARRCLARLEELELTEKAAAQLSDLDSCTLLGDDQGKLTKDFLFGRGTGMACALEDILWFYRVEKSRLFLLPRTVMMAGTRHTLLRTAVNLKRFDRLNITNDVAGAIAKRSGCLLLGKSRKNAAAFKNMCK